MKILILDNLFKSFGGIKAVDGVSLAMDAGVIYSIVGPNGAGKTTLANLISGFLAPDKGKIIFEGKDITKTPMHKRVRMGIVRSFQLPQLFARHTVLENILISLSARDSINFKKPKIDIALEILELFSLNKYKNYRIEELSEGHKKILDVALAYALAPKILLLDEPTSGVSRDDKFIVMENILNAIKGITLVFIEHDMEVVKKYSEIIIYMGEGRVLKITTPAEATEVWV